MSDDSSNAAPPQPSIVPPSAPVSVPPGRPRWKQAIWLVIGGAVLAVGGCGMFLTNLNMNTDGGFLANVGAVLFVVGLLAFVIGGLIIVVRVVVGLFHR